MLQLIVFDLDGTLVDSRLDLAESANELLAEYGAAALPTEAVTAMVGEGARVLVSRVLTSAGVERPLPEALDRFLAIYDRRLVVHTRPYEGVIEALERLEGRVSLAVLTNKPGHHTSGLLAALHLDGYFGQVIGGDSRFPRKPDPAALHYLIEDAHATGASTILVGDSPVDAATARNAGCRLCLAGYGFAAEAVVSTLGPGDLFVRVATELGATLAGALA